MYDVSALYDNSALSAHDLLSGGAADASAYVQTDLVSNVKGLAEITDPNLINAWGVSFISTPSSSSPFWISNQGTNSTTVYSVTGSTGVSPELLKVDIPTTASPPNGPTGQVSNPNSKSFILGDGTSALFIFANLNGQISAWNQGEGTTASVEWTTPGAVYTGLAVNEAHTMLYAANDSAGTIDVYNSSFQPVSLGHNAFATPEAIAKRDLVPFNVTDIGGNVFVTYAPEGHTAQTRADLGEGAVAVFNERGQLEPFGALLGGPHDPLAAPWGVAVAPSDWGRFSGDLLVGNFSYAHSEINAFNFETGQFEGRIPIFAGSGQLPGGLWDLTFGGGGSAGSRHTLYFTDGINGETGGLFGAITSEPLPFAHPGNHPLSLA
jgi:uncharacterized protein (TIGR03118 family)